MQESAVAERDGDDDVHTNDSDCRVCDPCEAEFIDGSYDDCGCCECRDREGDRIESAHESGDMTEDEAMAAHEANGTWEPVDEDAWA